MPPYMFLFATPNDGGVRADAAERSVGQKLCAAVSVLRPIWMSAPGDGSLEPPGCFKE